MKWKLLEEIYLDWEKQVWIYSKHLIATWPVWEIFNKYLILKKIA